MNNLLVFFAIPVATIILSAILETFINCPLKVGGIFFSIFLVVAAALGGTIELLFAAIVYTMLIVQSLFMFISYIKRFFYVIILSLIAPVVVVYDFGMSLF